MMEELMREAEAEAKREMGSCVGAIEEEGPLRQGLAATGFDPEGRVQARKGGEVRPARRRRRHQAPVPEHTRGGPHGRKSDG